jgi:hypothetical protein
LISPRTSTSPSIDGVSRTATAPGPERLDHQPKSRELLGAGGKARSIGLVQLDDLRDEKDLTRNSRLLRWPAFMRS